MFIVKYTNKDDGGTLSDKPFNTSEQAEQYIQDSFQNDPELAGDILQLVEIDAEGKEVNVWAEYTKEEFNINI